MVLPSSVFCRVGINHWLLYTDHRRIIDINKEFRSYDSLFKVGSISPSNSTLTWDALCSSKRNRLAKIISNWKSIQMLRLGMHWSIVTSLSQILPKPKCMNIPCCTYNYIIGTPAEIKSCCCLICNIPNVCPTAGFLECLSIADRKSPIDSPNSLMSFSSPASFASVEASM